MEPISKTTEGRIKALKLKSRDGKGKEYRALWVTVNFATAKDLHIRQIGARAFGLFLVIRTHMGREGIAYPSLKTIAYLGGCSIGTAQKEIKKLIRNGWLKKDGRVRDKNGRFGNTKYRILEINLIRGTGQKGFLAQPLTNSANGE